MDEYINREAAIKRIKEYALNAYGIDLDDSRAFSGNSLPENYCEGLYEATELIDDLPAADVEPVVHGEWITIEKWAAKAQYKCSVCGRRIMASLDVAKVMGKYPYCNCGAKMEGVR